MATLNRPLPQYAAAAFSQLRRVEQIRTMDVKMSAFAPFVTKVAPGLRSLHLHFAVHGNSRLDGLAVVLSSCTTLEDLEIRYNNERHPHSPLNLGFGVQTLTRTPRLQHLSLAAGQYHTSMIPFAALFSSTLVNLKLSATSTTMSGIISPAPHCSSETFPRVEKLSLSGLDSLTRTTRRSIEPRHFPALTTLELDLTLAPWTSRTDSPLSTFSTFHHLRNLSIPNLLSMGEASSDEVVRFAEDNALSLQPSPRASSTDYEEEDSFEAFLPPSRRAGAKLRKTLAYLEEQVQKAEEQDDDVALHRYRDVLKTVEVERVVDELWKGA